MSDPHLGLLGLRADTRAVLAFYEAEATDGTITKKGSARQQFPLQFNPREYQVQAQAEWQTDSNNKGGVGQYKGTNPFTIGLEVFIDEPTRESMEAKCPKLVEQVDILLGSVHRFESSPLPPLLEFTWGPRSFQAVAKSVTAKYSMFSADGEPIRATCTLQLTVLPETWARQNPTSGTPRIDRAHRVVLGDSLASIAYEKYGDPTLWRAVALANGLDDPTRPPLGRYVVVPSRADAERMR
jgi:nucleoid-associated protein YgaU